MQIELCISQKREDTKNEAYEVGDISRKGEGIVGNKVRLDVGTVIIKATRRNPQNARRAF